MESIVVVTDNTMGIPAMEIDDGLALLYLLGMGRAVEVAAVVTTHGNAPVARTWEATRALAPRIGYNGPLVRGGDPGEPAGAAARTIAELAAPGTSLLSLGATTELALAEKLAPGCLGAYDAISAMGGITQELCFGEKVMDELNFSVDAAATLAAFSAGGEPRFLIADAQHCLPLTFRDRDVVALFDSVGPRAGAMARELLVPWFEHAAGAWGVEGLVGWDVLAAVALAEPELVRLRPLELALDPEGFARGWLREGADRPAVPSRWVYLVEMADSDEVAAHVQAAWRRALEAVE